MCIRDRGSGVSGYQVVYVEPGKPAVEKEIGSKLEDLQEAVGGLIECVYPLSLIHIC